MAIGRRQFISALGGATVAWPLIVRAQQPALPVIGFLDSGSPDGMSANLAAFQRGLGETGYREGTNFTIEYRWARGQYDQLPVLAAELVRRQVAVIAATRNPAPGLAAKAATSTIPIVFQTGTDPVQDGLVASLNRPGGNVTGVSRLSNETIPKRLGLISELLPNATVIAVLVNPTNFGAAARTAAPSCGRRGCYASESVAKLFLGVRTKFFGPLVRLPKNYVGGRMISSIFNRQPS